MGVGRVSEAGQADTGDQHPQTGPHWPLVLQVCNKHSLKEGSVVQYI